MNESRVGPLSSLYLQFVDVLHTFISIFELRQPRPSRQWLFRQQHYIIIAVIIVNYSLLFIYFVSLVSCMTHCPAPVTSATRPTFALQSYILHTRPSRRRRISTFALQLIVMSVSSRATGVSCCCCALPVPQNTRILYSHLVHLVLAAYLQVYLSCRHRNAAGANWTWDCGIERKRRTVDEQCSIETPTLAFFKVFCDVTLTAVKSCWCSAKTMWCTTVLHRAAPQCCIRK